MKITDFPSLEAAFRSNAAAARALGMTPQAFQSLKEYGHLPARSYLKQKAILERLGHEVEETLWSFEQPADSAA